MSGDVDLARYRARKKLFALLDELEIHGRVREEMGAEPERALQALREARRACGIKNRAAFAITRWRQAQARGEEPELLEPELLGVPPDLDALEAVWAREPSLASELVLQLFAAAVPRYGGLSALRESFERRRIGDA